MLHRQNYLGATITVVFGLTLLRLVPTIDPIAPLLRQVLLRDSNTTMSTQTNNGEVDQLRKEIANLRSELDFTSQANGEFIAADITSKAADSFRQSVRIIGGLEDGIRPYQAVLYNGHMIGVVDDVEPGAASVLLLGDPSLKIAVAIGTTGIGLVEAQAGGLVIDKVVSSKQIVEGELVTTNGLGGLYPPGMLLGVVGKELDLDVFSKYILEVPYHRDVIDRVLIRVR